jgi:hypothetical protein
MSGIQIVIMLPIIGFVLLGLAEYFVLTTADRSGK